MLDPRTPLPPSGLAGFGDVDAAGDPAAYIAFLDGFQRSLAAMIDTGIDALRIPAGGSVLDVGCGHGAAFERLAAKTGPTGRIAGLDASRTLLDEARRRCSRMAMQVELHAGDAHRLPFADEIFDAARADRVLIFLRDPAAALDELVRVTRRGGRVVVTEADLGSAVVDAPDVEVTRAVLAAAGDALPHGWIGRRLRGLFVERGLVDLEVRMFGVQSTHLGEWSRRVGIEAAARRAVCLGRTSAGAVETWMAGLQERDRAGRFFAAGSFFMASATLPGA